MLMEKLPSFAHIARSFARSVTWGSASKVRGVRVFGATDPLVHEASLDAAPGFGSLLSILKKLEEYERSDAPAQPAVE